jgi:hypothetical protein
MIGRPLCIRPDAHHILDVRGRRHGMVHCRQGPSSADAREKQRAREETRIAVRQSLGLELEGDPIGRCSMRGIVRGVDLTTTIKTTCVLPGPSDVRRAATTVAGSVPLPDQIVCRSSEVDLIMGALPTLPRQATSHPNFDAAYAVFVSDGGPAAMGYRHTVASAIAWADPTTLTEMLAQRLIFMRVQRGRCELVFEPTPASEVVPLVTIAANVVRRAAGTSIVVPQVRSAPVVTAALSYEPVMSVMLGSLVSLFLAPFGAGLAFLPPLRELNAETECGKGGEIRVSSSSDGDGTTYGLYCSNHRDASLVGHYASALSIFFTLFLGAATIVGLTRWPKPTRF